MQPLRAFFKAKKKKRYKRFFPASFPLQKGPPDLV